LSGSSTPSYYEIALSNRQVLIGFVVLLVCLFVSFVSGVWVGRAGAEAPQATTAAAEQGEISELRFFSGGGPLAEGGAAGGSPAAEETPPVTPAASPVSQPPPLPAPPAVTSAPPGSDAAGSSLSAEREPKAEETAARRAPERAAATAPATERAPAPPATIGHKTPELQSGPALSEVTPREEAARKPLPIDPRYPPLSSLPKPAEEPESVPEEETPKPKVVDPPSVSELWDVQVFSTAEESQARAFLARLTNGGFRAFLSPVQVDNKTMYRVRVGPFPDRDEAQAKADELRHSFRVDTWVTAH
jgi:cell division septation protein DedD